jgi:hypothetical protein
MTNTALGLTSASDFADEFLGEDPGIDMAEAGPACADLASRLPDHKVASSLIATIVWDVFSRTFTFDETVGKVTGSQGSRHEFFVVRHPLFGGRPRHDLLVLDSTMRDLKPQTTSIPRDRQNWIAEGLEYRARDRSASIDYPIDDLARVIEEAISVQPFGIIVAEPPPTIRLSERTFAVPSPPLAVRREEDSERYGSAGVVARSTYGTLVLTTALHALRKDDDEAIPDATEVWLGQAPGAVAASHEITDSAILIPDNPEELDVSGSRSLRGLLRGMPPREHERMTFDGVSSGEEHPYVTAWSPDILTVTRYSQAKVLTTPDTVPGDSGSALFDEADNLVGFSFERSAFNARPEYSSWIWADSVISFHGLEPLELVEQ